MKTITLAMMLLFTSVITYAQTTVKGRVIDDTDQPIPLANITLRGMSSVGTVADFDGFFELTISETLPFALVASSVGYESNTVEVTSSTEDLVIRLSQGTELDVVVISASRTPERIFESPVSVERFGIKEIKNTAAADFYSGLSNLKGVDVNTNSLTLQSVNTRGFTTLTNTRFVQLVDGMDNSAPSLNFALGNLLGMSELDVNSVEILPGASSALYGANAFNGILFMTSKNPFDHQGISGYLKGGITSQEAAGDNEFYDYGVRMAHAFSDKFAAKVNFSHLRGTDWLAADYQDLSNPGADRSDPGYDGLNVYGDIVGTELPFGIGYVSRTGYNEEDLNNNQAESIKFDAALHYRPFADDFEIIYNGKIGTGNTVSQDANKTALRNFFVQQHKLEVKNSNFFLRGYLTEDKAGDSYELRLTGININNRWKENGQWFNEYAGAYLQAIGAGADSATAHAGARAFADTGRFLPGTVEFQNAFNDVTNDTDFGGTGSAFRDNSKFKHADGNYNFSHITGDIVDVQVGGSYREYKLNSFGTIFTDADAPIYYSEYGIYTQLQKKILDERLKLTGSIRYDKAEIFDGNFSPRISVGYTLGEARNHNIRVSYQTGFRNPATQDLYAGLDTGALIALGSAPDNLDRYRFTDENGNTITGRDAYENSYSLESVQNGAPVQADIDIVEPEKVRAYELGYRGKLGTLSVDVSGYYNQYTDFISNENVIVPLFGSVADGSALAALQTDNIRVFSASTNSDVDISSYGVNAGINAKVLSKLDVGVNYTYAKQDFDQEDDPDFRSNFNTPEHKFKASVGSTNLFNNFGFMTNLRWSDAFFWQADFGDGTIDSYTVLDAQINYRIPALKATLKAGMNNILGDEYVTAIGSGFIGSQAYIGLSINNL
ncbi:TonB-dependent receptor [Aquimarina addita]|uniref:TonB-dependent receptor n=1 Tax=Aquimarina addita TaxID=870485 RepID=A0ABP6UIE2_9FLAO